ncbi:hypothetical protein AVEN_175941-1 [Araneus ventricosus]|uniref:Uncharacterized protein n=1 Tax=Araneus ventricosus TaxID=182803 RepID=A0A4Y2PDV6_ARAVE|nr:hypothetical protein AVEN_175941-1 [Araneus ventricosus]
MLEEGWHIPALLCVPLRRSFLALLLFHDAIHNQTNIHFLNSVLSINVLKVSFRSKSRVLYNFLNDFFLVSFTVYEIGPLIPQFADRWRCKLSHRVAHILFTIPRYQLYGLSCHRLEVKEGVTDISRNPVYTADQLWNRVSNPEFSDLKFENITARPPLPHKMLKFGKGRAGSGEILVI